MMVDMQRKLRQAFGSFKDYVSMGKAIMQNRNTKGFSDIEVAVVRATGHDDGLIDDNHVHEILFLVSNTSGSIPFLAERISRRLGKTRDRFVAMKTLLLIHRLLRGGNHGFEQKLRTAYASGHLQIRSRWFLENPDPSFLFMQSYASYLEERVGWRINQAGKLEPLMCGGLKYRRHEEKLVDLVFRKLPRCQEFIERVLNCSPFDSLPLDNLVQTAIKNTLKESFQVYVTYRDGVAALVDMFFDLATPARSMACDMLKRASRQSQDLQDLYDKCRRVTENKSLEYPHVQAIVMDHVTALEQCSSNKSSTDSSAMSKTQPKSPSACDLLTAPANVSKTALEEEKGGGKTEVGGTFFSPNPFTWTMETKISTVWVAFEDEDRKYM